MKIVVAGASGFVGSKLLENLRQNEKHHVIALSRSQKKEGNGIEWRKCDLFSLKDAESATKGADIAVYLVHSMLPTDRLSQGSFLDHDLISADNFARACQKNNIRQIVYLSGIVPKEEALSDHLKSRFEVEKTLSSYSPALTTLRSGLIIGAEGSTFQILMRLTERLPIMLCPSWTRSKTEAVDIQDVVKILSFCISNPDTYNKSFDIGSREVLNYQEMMKVASQILNKRRVFLPISLLSRKLSSYWLTLVTRAPLSLTSPIIESLKHDIYCEDHSIFVNAGFTPTPIEESIGRAYKNYLKVKVEKKPKAYQKQINDTSNVVRSVQRLIEKPQINAENVAEHYMNFLNKLFFGFMSIERIERDVFFRISFTRTVLLKITHSPERSEKNRQLFYVTGGLLADESQRARLEFRVVPGAKVLISALHDYVPKLPWWIYTWTQALIHLMVMKLFARYMQKQKS